MSRRPDIIPAVQQLSQTESPLSRTPLSQTDSPLTRKRPRSFRILGVFAGVVFLFVVLVNLVMVYLGYQSPTEAGFSVLKESILIVSFSVFLDWLVLREMRTVARVNALLHAVVEETTDAIFVKDHNGKYLLINTATTHFVGKSISEMMGQDDNAPFLIPKVPGLSWSEIFGSFRADVRRPPRRF